MNATQEAPLMGGRSTFSAWVERVGLALAFSGLGFLIFVVFSPYRPRLSDAADLPGRLILGAALLAAALLARRSQRWKNFTPVLYGLLVMLAAVSVDMYLGPYVCARLNININTPRGLGLQKLIEAAIVVSVVVLMALLGGGSLGSLYLQKGDLRFGLAAGLGLFALSAAAAVPLANFAFMARGVTAERLLGWTPWLLMMALSNGVLEELLFRGLFLRKLEPFFGRLGSNLLVMFVFTVLHLGATYTSEMVGFIAVTSLLALAWGWLMQRSNTLWASALFHAGMDLPIFIGILSNL